MFKYIRKRTRYFYIFIISVGFHIPILFFLLLVIIVLIVFLIIVILSFLIILFIIRVVIDVIEGAIPTTQTGRTPFNRIHTECFCHEFGNFIFGPDYVIRFTAGDAIGSKLMAIVIGDSILAARPIQPSSGTAGDLCASKSLAITRGHVNKCPCTRHRIGIAIQKLARRDGTDSRTPIDFRHFSNPVITEIDPRVTCHIEGKIALQNRSNNWLHIITEDILHDTFTKSPST